MAATSLFQDILRTPDEVKVVLEAALVTTSDNQDQQNRRVLAVVSHKEDWDLTEEGSLFICKYKTSVNGRPEELDIQRVLPIYGHFSVIIGQMRRGTDFQTSMATSKSMLEQPGADITINITPAEGFRNDNQLPVYFTRDIGTLKALMSECRRLKEVSDVETNAVINLASSTTHFSWLKPYLEKNTTINTLTSIRDLRQLNRPLLDRLSPACAGSMGDDHADAQTIRDDWIRTHARDMTRIGRRRLSLRLGTFNVNGKMPSQDLSSWVRGDVKPSEKASVESEIASKYHLPPTTQVSPISLGEVVTNPFTWVSQKLTTPASPQQVEQEEEITRVDVTNPEDPDLFVLGFQELDLSTEALIYSTGTIREDAWCLAIFAALGEKAVNYEKLVSKQLVGMLIVIFVKKSLKDCFGEIRTSVAGAGILGVMGNKGGTAVRITFTPPADGNQPLPSPGPTSLTFVNAHLAAFDEMVDKRNSDFQDLSRRLSFEGTPPRSFSPSGEGGGSDDHATVEIPMTPSTGLPSSLSVYETDALFWMGDLNYRVDIPDMSMRRILHDEQWDNESKFEALTRFDQLTKSMKSKKAFEGFKEAPITHPPTYRFSPGLAMDKMGYDIKRKPAWTDRILYMYSPTSCIVRQLSYTGHPQIKMSDHRPVAADFSVDVDLYDAQELQTNVRNLFHGVQNLGGENTYERGGLQIDNTYIDFGNVSYGSKIERKISVRNISKNPFAFRFVPVQIDTPIHPEWLSIQPLTGMILPNESIDISLKAVVDNNIASILNLRPKDLSGTLILHTVMGEDHFVPVSGEYQYTCFANKLSRLTRLRGPIRSLESPNDLLPENNSINAPREIMRLINWMMTSTGNTETMFVTAADHQIMKTIIECLDTGEEFLYTPEKSGPEILVAFAATLLAFLESLPDSIIPASLHHRCLEMTSRDEAFELLDVLPPASVNVWISVTAFLHYICQTAKVKDHAKNIAKVLAPVLLRDDVNSLAPPISPNRKCTFLLYFIT